MSRVVKIIPVIILLSFVFSGCGTTGYYFNETYDMAKKNYEAKNYADAQKYYQKFIDENPENSMVEVSLYYLADSYRLSGQTDKAKATYKKVIDKYKDSFWANAAKKDLESIK